MGHLGGHSVPIRGMSLFQGVKFYCNIQLSLGNTEVFSFQGAFTVATSYG